MSPKLLYLVFTVVITFEGTRGNVGTGSPIPIKHVREVLPPSLLFLLRKRPTSGLGYKNITPVPVSPVPPSAPVEQFAPLPPSIPAIPNAPVSPSIPYSPDAPIVPYTGIHPNSFYPTAYGQSHQQATQSSSGQLSYDNPSYGNRKILNIVHVNPRPQPIPISRQTSQPTSNPAGTDNKVTETSKDVSTNSFQINPKDIPFEPVKNIEASPIPVKPKNTEIVPSQPTNVDSETKESKDSDQSKKSFEINPKDIPFEPVNNIEASPIPVQSKNTDVSSQATNVDSETKKNKDVDQTKNSFEINPKDIPFEPVKNIEASPIPVQSKNTEVVSSQPTNVDGETKENKDVDQSKNSYEINPKDIPFEPVNNIEASPIPVQSKNTDVSSQATNVDSETKKNKDVDQTKNSFEINPKDIRFEPVKNIEASPIPVQSKNTDVVSSQATNANSAPSIAEKSNEGKNSDLTSSVGNSEANANPEKSLIKPELSEEKAAVSDSKDTPDVPSSASEYNNADKASKTEEPQNPLKDLILNGNASNKNADKEESKQAQDSENKADTQNGNSSSQNENEVSSEKQEDNLNKQTTESGSTNNESPTDGTHSASTYNESSEGSHSESNEHESEATSSNNTQSQSTHSQSDNETDSDTKSSNGANNSSEATEGISSARIEKINHEETVKEN